eukprot:12304915-Alexandrium_andersonii.AAC.1
MYLSGSSVLRSCIGSSKGGACVRWTLRPRCPAKSFPDNEYNTKAAMATWSRPTHARLRVRP